MEDPSSSFNSQRIKEFIQENLLPLALGLIGLIFLVIGLIQLNSPKKELKFESSTSSKEEVKAESTKKETIFVDVGGSVVKAGVYELNSDSRIKDALVAASGLAPNADREFVDKKINLAQKLIDGMKLYIPAVGETVGTITSVSSDGIVNLDERGQININLASSSELDTLPGVGVATAQKIIGGRPYGSIDELLNKKIVGKSVFEKIKDKIGI